LERHQERLCNGNVDRQSVGEDVDGADQASIRIRRLAGLAVIPLLTKVTMHRIDIINYF
jgi:hypothetical protein